MINGKWKHLVSLAKKNAIKNWRHSLATLSAIATGFVAISLFDGYLVDIEDQNQDMIKRWGMLGDIIIERKGASEHRTDDSWSYMITPEDQKWIETFLASEPGFVRRVRFLTVSGLASNGASNAGFLGYGYDVSDGAQMRAHSWSWNTIRGKPLQENPDGMIVVGASFAKLLGCSWSNSVTPQRAAPFECPGGRILLSSTTQALQLNALDLPVGGIMNAVLREADRRWVVMPLSTAQTLLDTKDISYMSIEIRDPKDTDLWIHKLTEAAQLHQSSLIAIPTPHHIFASSVRGGIQVIHVFRSLFMAVVIIVAVLSVMNTMTKTVSERMREIGTLRSFGFQKSDVQFLFSFEGLILSLLACSVGLLMTLTGTALINALGLSYQAGILSTPLPLKVAFIPLAWAKTAIFLSVLAGTTAWMASRRAVRLKIADALRQNS